MLSLGASPVRVYRTAWGYRLLVVVASLVVLALGVSLLVLAFPADRLRRIDVTTMCLIAGAGSVIIACLVYALLSTFRQRLEIYSDRVRYVRLLGVEEIQIDAVRGFRVIATENENAFHLLPKDPTVKAVKIALTIEDKAGFIEWANRSLINLDETEFQEEMRTALSDGELGGTEEERASLLKRAKRWSACLSIVSTGIAVWAVIKPYPYEYVMWTLIVLPPATLVSQRFFRGALRFEWKARSAYSSIAPALYYASGGLALCAFRDWNILQWNNFWYPFSVAFLGLFFLAIMHGGDTWRKIRTALLLLAVCAIYAYGATILVNGLLDRSPPVTYQARVAGVRVSTGKSTSYYLRLSPWGPRKTADEIEVSRSVYERHKPGDQIQIIVRNGRFSIPWFEVR